MTEILAYQNDEATGEPSRRGRDQGVYDGRDTGSIATALPYRPSMGLRRTLIALDSLALTAAWTSAIWFTTAVGWWYSSLPHHLAIVGVGVIVGVGAMAAQRLYLARTSAVRSVLVERLGKAVGLGAAGVLLLGRLGFYDLPMRMVLPATGLAFVLLAGERLAFESWLARNRSQGRYTRPVLLVGINEEAAELCEILADHPEFGLKVVGAVGYPDDGAPPPVPVMGDYLDAVEACHATGATGALVIGSVVPPSLLNDLTRDLLEAEVHVHFSSGLRGIATHRVRPLPIAHEPLFYVEKVTLRRWQSLLKRYLDVALASAALLAFLPVLVTAMALIKLEDGGPLVYRQQRVGYKGALFPCYKLRTMVPDADKMLDVLQGENQRNGPLFKLARDPRVTRIGHLLRATSIDELPQLWNVLRGHMSLVGPRPALPSEVEQFDARLRARSDVPPGITGLWQVEARDNPAFGPYRRLDLFYIENWSIALDLSILLSTAAVVGGRAVRGVLQRMRPVGGHQAAPAGAVLD